MTKDIGKKKFEMDEEQEQIDFIQPKKTVGKLISVDVLDKIKDEIENDWQLKKYPSSPFSCGLRRAIDIIDKYKKEV